TCAGMPAKARICAYAVTRRVFEQGAYADRALQTEARSLDARDRALAMRLAFGAIQRRGTLDHLIERLAGRPVGKLDAPLLAALRLGLYEMLYTSGAPDRAVVADAVELAKLHGPRAAHGLVNAVLRRAAREGADTLLGDLRDETPGQAAVMHSHPEWIARLWWEELGSQEARALLAADNDPGELVLRVNTLVADPGAVAETLGVSLHTDPELPEALVVDGPFDLHASESWRSGAVIAQSRAAMLVARALDPRPGERVLDLCAAPGGKSTHIAALMGDEGEVLAVERNPARAAALQETARRLRTSSVRVDLADAASPRREGAVFDRVLVDPPCSGLGTLQSRPDLRWRVTPESVREMTGIQARILAAGAAALRPGGVLVYSTCTISPRENEQQIELFLGENSDFALDDLTRDQTIHTHPRASKFMLTMPHRERMAGFFVARMRRVRDSSASRL
ncbi:MAG: 16S rRNA (cytosine(967)-C(5))-methyltransferase RsmB, partial [Solirubrobacteraceae bacterium]